MSHYPKAYGVWSGNPKGKKPNFTRCCQSITPKQGFPIPYQCKRARGYGPDKAYCKIHDPKAVEERLAKAKSKSEEKSRAWFLSYNAETFYKALKSIAEGHNDPRSLAQETIAKFEARFGK